MPCVRAFCVIAVFVLMASAHATETRILTVKAGDTLSSILTKLGVSSQNIALIADELQHVYDVSQLKPGQTLTISYQKNHTAYTQINSIDWLVSAGYEVRLLRLSTGLFLAWEKSRMQSKKLHYVELTIKDSLFNAAKASQVPYRILANLLRHYSYDVDFQRDIRKGNRLQLLYEQYYDAEEQPSVAGTVIYSNLKLKQKNLKLYQFLNKKGQVHYYNEKGEHMKKALMRSPIDGARISSGFGRRKHPILGYTRMHKGVDFAAPRGTAIYAAGDGTISRIGRNGGYGNYIKIRHKNHYSTAYAHLHRFAKGMRKNKYVKQGTVIGYVGTTGRSTGPHLHYEVLRYNRHVNPLSIKTASLKQLKSVSLGIFQQYQSSVDAYIQAKKHELLANNSEDLQ